MHCSVSQSWFRAAILRRMIPPQCRRFGEKVMRQLNISERDRTQNRMPVLIIPPYRLSRTFGAAPVEKQLRSRENAREAGFSAGKARINHVLRAQAWADGAWPFAE
jgi:hypothetical protein